jgi:predicted transcriptional regulator
MATTIQISESLQEELTKRKLFDRETYEEVIWDLVEDSAELSEETKKEIKKAEEEIKKGKFYTHEQIKKELGI